MSRDTVADAIDRAAEALAQAAHELRGTSPGPEGASAAPPPRSSAPAAPTGQKYTRCPSHGKDFIPSKNPEWAAYCPSQSDDPAWTNKKGYCKITDRNAAEWVAIHGHVNQEPDEVPF